MTKSKFVSIIIPCYNSEKFIHKCLSSVLRTDYPYFEVIIVDNASKDSTYKIVKEHFSNFSNLKVIKLPQNYGFAKACNIGSRIAKGEYIVFLNSDILVDDRKWLSKMVSYMESNPNIAILQAKLINYNNPKIIDNTGGFIDKFGFGYTRGHNEIDIGQYDMPSYIFFASGAAMMIRKKIWEKEGGFDTTFFFYYEDIDLSWRVWKKGYKVVYFPASTIRHLGHGSTPINSLKDRETYFKIKFAIAMGRLYLLLKNHTFLDIIKYVPATFLIQLANVFRYIINKDSLAGMATLLGTFTALYKFINQRFFEKRKGYILNKLFLRGLHIHNK